MGLFVYKKRNHAPLVGDPVGGRCDFGCWKTVILKHHIVLHISTQIKYTYSVNPTIKMRYPDCFFIFFREKRKIPQNTWVCERRNLMQDY